jgi:hypothetical protein
MRYLLVHTAILVRIGLGYLFLTQTRWLRGGRGAALDLSANAITEDGNEVGLVAIADAISGMDAILSVNLLENSIGFGLVENLVSSFKEHDTLKSLCGNKGDETKLDMSGKMTHSAGYATMLAVEIVDNKALTSLTLSLNRLCAKGATIVANAIKVTECVIAVVLALFWCPSLGPTDH